jgi:hypothetical protein
MAHPKFLRDFRFSWQRIRRWMSDGLLHRVVCTDVSEMLATSIIRVMSDSSSWWRRQPRHHPTSFIRRSEFIWTFIRDYRNFHILTIWKVISLIPGNYFPAYCVTQYVLPNVYLDSGRRIRLSWPEHQSLVRSVTSTPTYSDRVQQQQKGADLQVVRLICANSTVCSSCQMPLFAILRTTLVWVLFISRHKSIVHGLSNSSNATVLSHKLYCWQS